MAQLEKYGNILGVTEAQCAGLRISFNSMTAFVCIQSAGLTEPLLSRERHQARAVCS